MKTTQSIGILLILGAIGVFIPYTLLTMVFDYPDILRQDPGVILTRFQQGGPALIFIWWAFALMGLPLLIAYVRIGQQFEQTFGFIRWVTTLGVISGIAQIIGLLRWVFVVPVLARAYILADDAAQQEAIRYAFILIHQFAGVLLGEHIGQLFTIVWSVLMAYAFMRLRVTPVWVGVLGIAASIIYLAAQAELVATVIPRFPAWALAGFLGSTLWLVWLIIVGVYFLRGKRLEPDAS